MKNTLRFLLASLLLVFTLTACGGGAQNSAGNQTGSAVTGSDTAGSNNGGYDNGANTNGTANNGANTNGNSSGSGVTPEGSLMDDARDAADDAGRAVRNTVDDAGRALDRAF